MIKKMRYFGVITILAMFLLFVPMVSAELTVKTIELPIGHIPTTTSGTDYIQSKVVDSPDGISKILAFQIKITGDFTPSTEISAMIRPTGGDTIYECEPATWTTPPVNSPNYEAVFDCTGLSEHFDKVDGKIDVGMKTDKAAQNVKGEFKITYLNNPRGSMIVHGTEYDRDDDNHGKIWLQLIGADGEYVTNGVCWIDIYTPSNEEYLEKATMTNMVHDGIYYYDLQVPRAAGVYPAIARCYYNATNNINYYDSSVLYDGVIEGGVIGATHNDDTVEFKFKTDDNLGAENRLNLTFNSSTFNTNCSTIDEQLLTGITILWKGKWETDSANHYMNISLWNYTSSSWIILDNQIPGGGGGDIQTVTNSITTNNTTVALGLSATNQLMIQFKDAPNVEGQIRFKTRYAYASCDQLTDPEWQTVKGSSEMHVKTNKPYGEILEGGELFNESFLQRFWIKYTVESFVNEYTANASIQLESFKDAMPCGHLNNVIIKNRTTGLWQNVTGAHMILGDNDVCSAHFHYDLYHDENLEVRLDMENYWKKKILAQAADNNLLNNTAAFACYVYQNFSGLTPYQVPTVDQPNHSTDLFYTECAGFLDSTYRWRTHFFSFLPLLNTNYNFTPNQLHDLEGLYAHTTQSGEEVWENGMTIMAALTANTQFSQGILANNPAAPVASEAYQTFFANFSNVYQNAVALNRTANNVWSYDNRTLTNYSEISIANAVWAFSGTIGINIITQVVQAVWDYAGIPATTLLNNITSNVWDYSNRSLTNYTIDVEAIWNYNNRTLTEYLQNDTATAENVWNYSNGRYTHGVII